jgi:hypothetical protein
VRVIVEAPLPEDLATVLTRLGLPTTSGACA